MSIINIYLIQYIIMVETDNILKNKYRIIFGLDNITNISNNTIFQDSVTCLSNLNVSNNSFINNNTSLLSNINVSNMAIIGSTSILSSLYIKNNLTVNGNITTFSNINILNNVSTNSNINVNKSLLINKDLTIMSWLNVSGTTNINNTIYTNNIIPNLNTITLNGDIINLGVSNSIINILATSTYVATNDLKINDKIFELNINANNLSAYDIGSLSGFEILGIADIGFIKTTSDATRYLIKYPTNPSIEYILTSDANNNILISGQSLLYNNCSIRSSLYNAENAYYNRSMSIGSSLYVLNNIASGNATINSSLNIHSNLINNKDISINSTLLINNSSNFYNLTILSNLNTSNISQLINNITINNTLYISNTAYIRNNYFINNLLNVSNNTIIEGNITNLSNLNVLQNTIIRNNTSIRSNLYISGITNINGNVSINSNININGDVQLCRNNTLGSSLKQINFLGQILCKIPEYLDNNTASLNGVPIGGFYRTGGILKVRVDDIAPVLTLLGSESIAIETNSIYIDSGVTAIDNIDGIQPVYIISISNAQTTINMQILITGTSTVVSQTNTLSPSTYTITYMAQDNIGNKGYTTRTLVVNPPNYILVDYVSENIITSYMYWNLSVQILPTFNNKNMTIASSGVPNSTTVNTSWRLTQQLFNSINFNINSNWCFVIKFKRVTNNNANEALYIFFDKTDNFADWGPMQTAGKEGNYRGMILLRDTRVEINYENKGNINLVPNLNSGVYLNISYIYSTRKVRVEFVSFAGVTIYNTASYTSALDNITYTNQYAPFYIFQHSDNFTYYDNVYFNKTGYVGYSTYSPFFTSPL